MNQDVFLIESNEGTPVSEEDLKLLEPEEVQVDSKLPK